MDLDTFIILCRGLFLPEFLSNRLQTFAHYDPYVSGRCAMTFLSHTSCSSGFFSGFSGSLCGSMLVQLFTCPEKPMNTDG